MITDKKKFYYVLLQKRKLIATGKQLPIYWNKKVAEADAKLYRCDVVRIVGSQLEKLIIDSIK